MSKDEGEGLIPIEPMDAGEAKEAMAKVEQATEAACPNMSPEEVAADMTRAAASVLGDEKVCRLCTKTWKVKSYNFYDLCPVCFNEFNGQKMAGRFSFGNKMFFESSTEWIAHKLKEKEGSSA